MKIVGNTAPVELPAILNRDEFLSWTTTRRWRGLRSDLVDLADEVGGRVQIQQEEGVWHILEASFAGQLNGSGQFPTPDSQIVSVYEIDYARLDRSIWQREDVLTELAKIPTIAGRGEFRRWVESLASGEPVYKTTAEGRNTGVLVKDTDIEEAIARFNMDRAILIEVFNLLAIGVTNWSFELPIFKAQTVAPPNASLRAPLGGINTIIPTSVLLSRFPEMPPMYRESIGDQLGQGFWKVNSPRLRTPDATRVVLEQTFEFSQRYSKFLFGDPLTQ